jgi:hypothetical protein
MRIFLFALSASRAAAPWISPCAPQIISQLLHKRRVNLNTFECATPTTMRASHFWLVGDVARNVVVATIPFNQASGIRSIFNKRCFAKEGARCAEFRRNAGLRRRINMSTALRAVVFRDPYTRALALWRSLGELRTNAVTSTFFHLNCRSPHTCSFRRFAWILANEPHAKRDEHTLGQWEISRPDLMHYHFIGLLDDELDTILFWRDVMGGKQVREHPVEHVQPNASHVAPVRAMIKKIYAKDYAMLQSLKLLRS